MKIITTVPEAQRIATTFRGSGNSLGIIPTMGALHEGHLSLVRESRRCCDHTIATIFVNPTQFAEGEDLDQYPRTIESDLSSLQAEGVDAVFVPEADSMYPPNFSTSIEPPDVSKMLEGVSRPDHFSGVCTVVLKLFNILPASHAFFGRKDYQQYCVIQAMAKDLNVPIEIVACPIVRESDGLAMSSRNRYLDDVERVRALSLHAALNAARESYQNGERRVNELQECMQRVLSGDESRLGVDETEYAVIADAETLQPIEKVDRNAVALIAARVGATRLIDNMELLV